LIFISLGSQKFQFNRILSEIDLLVDKGFLKSEEIFAQIGYSDYKPKNFDYLKFLNSDEFKNKIEKCDLLITHGGTGSIMTGLRNNKKVIAIPRLASMNEHVDDHQLQIVNQFSETNIIEAVYDIKELKKAIILSKEKKYESYISNTDKIISIIEKFIEKM